MKMVIREYGGSVIAALVAVILLVSIFGTGGNSRVGLQNRLGSVLQDVSREKLKETGSPAFERYQSEVVPGMKYNQDKIIYNGVEVKLTDYFYSADGTVSCTVKAIRNISDQVWTTLNGDIYLFEDPGIYQLFLESENSSGKKKQCIVSFPVIEEQEES